MLADLDAAAAALRDAARSGRRRAVDLLRKRRSADRSRLRRRSGCGRRSSRPRARRRGSTRSAAPRATTRACVARSSSSRTTTRRRRQAARGAAAGAGRRARHAAGLRPHDRGGGHVRRDGRQPGHGHGFTPAPATWPPHADFHLSADALTFAELLAGVDHRIGRWRGPARFSRQSPQAGRAARAAGDVGQPQRRGPRRRGARALARLPDALLRRPPVVDQGRALHRSPRRSPASGPRPGT